MTIGKAIEELEKLSITYPFLCKCPESAALDLSIEALKALKAGREGRKYEFYAPLPGETEED